MKRFVEKSVIIQHRVIDAPVRAPVEHLTAAVWPEAVAPVGMVVAFAYGIQISDAELTGATQLRDKPRFAEWPYSRVAIHVTVTMCGNKPAVHRVGRRAVRQAHDRPKDRPHVGE